jgi:hypothetical protein
MATATRPQPVATSKAELPAVGNKSLESTVDPSSMHFPSFFVYINFASAWGFRCDICVLVTRILQYAIANSGEFRVRGSTLEHILAALESLVWNLVPFSL